MKASVRITEGFILFANCPNHFLQILVKLSENGTIVSFKAPNQLLSDDPFIHFSTKRTANRQE